MKKESIRSGGAMLTDLRRTNIINIIVYIFLGLFAFMILFPIWHIFVISVSSEEVFTNDTFHLLPVSFTLKEYKSVLFDSGGIVRSLGISVQVTVLGTALSMILTTIGGYTLSKKYLPGRDIIFKFIIFTMFFNGGLVPYYLLIRKLGFIDSILALTIPIAISSYNLIIMKNYFLTFPESLEESARIEGYNDIQILMRIVIPVSKPVIAAISLFYAVGYWNDYFMATLFINTNQRFPMQVVLRQMILQNMVLEKVGVSSKFSNPEQFKMACIITGMLPLLMVYPFIQKHFSRGIMLGAVKE